MDEGVEEKKKADHKAAKESPRKERKPTKDEVEQPPEPVVPPESFTLNPSLPKRSEKYVTEQRQIRWGAYLDYIDQVVTAGILSSIACRCINVNIFSYLNLLH